MDCPFKEIETLTTIAETALAAFDGARPPTTADIDDDRHYQEINAVQDATVKALVCPSCTADRSQPFCRMAA